MLLELGINHQVHICFTKLYYLVLSVLLSLTHMHVFSHSYTQAHNFVLKTVNLEGLAPVSEQDQTLSRGKAERESVARYIRFRTLDYWYWTKLFSTVLSFVIFLYIRDIMM